MVKTCLVLCLLCILPVTSLFAFAIPETAVTRTHLMNDIEQSTVTVGVGMEYLQEDPEPVYYADFLYVYLGYSPSDWLEFGVAVHSMWVSFYPQAETKLDLFDIFFDNRRLSCLLIGGIGGRRVEGGIDLLYHGGLALNYRVKENLQLYLGAGSDSASAALNLQGGLYFPLLDWLGMSTNIKVVHGAQGTEPMLSAALLAVF